MNRVLRIDEEKPEMHISVQGYTIVTEKVFTCNPSKHEFFSSLRVKKPFYFS